MVRVSLKDLFSFLSIYSMLSSRDQLLEKSEFLITKIRENSVKNIAKMILGFKSDVLVGRFVGTLVGCVKA